MRALSLYDISECLFLQSLHSRTNLAKSLKSAVAVLGGRVDAAAGAEDQPDIRLQVCFSTTIFLS